MGMVSMTSPRANKPQSTTSRAAEHGAGSRGADPTAGSLEQADDPTLLGLARQGDRGARDELARRHRPTAFRLALQLLGNREDARDLTQDSLLRFFTTLPRFDRDRPIEPWLRRIVRNGAIDRFRRGRVRRADSLDSDGPEGVAIEVESSRPGPEQLAQRRQLQVKLWECLHQLKPAHKEILVLRDYQDLAYREIAETLEVPIGTVMSRLHAARRQLRALLIEQGGWSED